jgi:hypothetical protein
MQRKKEPLGSIKPKELLTLMAHERKETIEVMTTLLVLLLRDGEVVDRQSIKLDREWRRLSHKPADHNEDFELELPGALSSCEAKEILFGISNGNHAAKSSNGNNKAKIGIFQYAHRVLCGKE